MATALAPRQRSNTSTSTTSSHETKSRSSTTSLQSTGAQPIQHHQYDASHHVSNQAQVYVPPTKPLQYNPEEVITQNHQQFSNPQDGYGIDPSLQNTIDHRRSMSLDPSNSASLATGRPPLAQHHSFDGTGQLAFHHEDPAQEDTGTEKGKPKKGTNSSAANDAELRRLYTEHRGRPLKEVAADVLVHERGPKAEKTKQIFAMLWLDAVCRKSSESVPRNRVFSHYATTCGTERVPPLNPASFGKLVRIIFPGIQTRRLGMRGESKYHYVDLSLIDDQQNNMTDTEHVPFIRDASVSLERPSLKRNRSQPPAESAAFPAPEEPLITPLWTQSKRRKTVHGSLLPEPAKNNMDQRHTNLHLLSRELKWPTSEDEPYEENEQLNLPSIAGYLPDGTDSDAANALTALYRSHCISIIDCFRFCKEKMLWHHFTAFHGTLTVPVQKLLAHPNIAAWIRECDWHMYQKMVRFVAPLAMQVVPYRVIDTIRNISNKLAKHISTTFQNLAHHVREAKLGPAVQFAALLDRLLRVNATAHAAANMLTNEANREQMWQDWCVYVKPGRVVEAALRGVGFHRCLWIITRDIRNLLGPLRCISYEGMDECFERANTESPPDWSKHTEQEDSLEGVLDRWTEFLYYLPSQFPNVDTREFIDRVSAVCLAALRDITVAQAPSFGSWWITKCWIDEMLLWTAEKGGFMDHKPSDSARPTEFEQLAATSGRAQEGFDSSRPITAASVNVGPTASYQNLNVQNGFHQQQGNHSHISTNGYHDQSYQDQTNQSFNAPHNFHPEGLNRSNTNFDVTTSQIEQRPGIARAHSYQPGLDYGGTQSGDGMQTSVLHRAASTNPAPQANAGINHSRLELDSHDDSGIGLGLEDDDISNIAKYGGFVADGLGSDPTDVRVC